MANSQPILTNLENLMKAAESESSLLQDPAAQIIGVSDVDESKSDESKSNESKSGEVDGLAKSSGNMAEDVKSALNNTNIASMLSRMASNPEEIQKVMKESMGQVTPDMMEQARKLATGGQGQQILQEMQRRGFDPQAMKSQMMEQRRSMRGLGGKTEATKQAILITASRQVKIRNVSPTALQTAAGALIGTDSPVELSCSRLAAGPLQGKTIKVWCEPQRLGKNKRLSKIIGFPVSGEGLFVMEEGDLTEKDFLAAEKLLA